MTGLNLFLSRSRGHLIRILLLILIMPLGLRCGGSNESTQGPGIGGSATDAMACTLSPSNYDTSCLMSSDCVRAAFGDFCSQTCACPTGYISRNASAQYMADFSQTPVGMMGAAPGTCECPLLTDPCCRNGECVSCFSLAQDSGPADAAYMPPPGSTLCSSTLGPVDASVADAGQARVCIPGETCTPFNGGWECCMSLHAGGTLCH